MLSEQAHRLRYALSIVEPSAISLRRFACPVCAGRFLLRLARNPVGVRCLSCGASAITLSIVSVLLREHPDLPAKTLYELSARGPLFEFLRRNVPGLVFSEYFDDVAPGCVQGDIRCQDVQNLTFRSASFDVVTSTEVFEHVPDDARGFAEVRRVLRTSGSFVFTVPIDTSARTVERAVVRDGKLAHLLPPDYHDDRIRGRGKVLVFRDYGSDIVQRLLAAGFSEAYIDSTYARAFLGTGREVIVARA